MLYRRKLMLAALTLSTALTAASLAASAEDVKRGGTLTIARPEEALTLEPFTPPKLLLLELTKSGI